MEAIINKNLSLDTMNFLIMQVISECKLNRLERVNSEEYKQFYSAYKLNNNSFYTNGILDRDLVRYFKVAVGAAPNLAELDNMEKPDYVTPIIAIDSKFYEGGAGTYTKLTLNQVDEFVQRYRILDYHGDDNTGFSATVFLDTQTGEKTISFRSTEYGEDFTKDALGADTEIGDSGTAIAQTASMVKYVESLKSKIDPLTNQPILNSIDLLNITGYSLGGHLAANFEKMYHEQFNMKQFIAFNAPGVGYVERISTTDAYVDLKNSLLKYDILLNKMQNLASTFNNSSSGTKNNAINLISDDNNISSENKIFIINFINSLSNTEFKDLLDVNTLNKAHLDSNIEIEVDKATSSIMNNYLSYKDSLYNNSFYKSYNKYLINLFNLSNPSSTITSGVFGEKTGIDMPASFYDNLAIWIGGVSATNIGDVAASDFNFVSNANIYTNPLDIVIEDRPEIEQNIGKLPFNFSWIQYLQGDFGVTHSITLLNKSLSLMTLLAKIEGNTSIDVQKYTGIIGSATTEKAAHWITKSEMASNQPFYNNLFIGDSNSIAVIVNSLYKMIIPNQANSSDIIFDNTVSGWGDINKINLLQSRMEDIYSTLGNKKIQIKSLYNANGIDFQGTHIYQVMDSNTFYNLAMQENSQGQAYRYALEKLNTFVVEGIDYSLLDFSSKNISSHSQEWYKTRIGIYLDIINANVYNYGQYMSFNSASIDDNHQGFNVNTYSDYLHAPFANGYNELMVSQNRPSDTQHGYDNTLQKTYLSEYSSKFYKSNQYNITINNLYDPIGNSILLSKIIKTITPSSEIVISVPMSSITANTYYLNPLASSFTSLRYNDNEKIFINPDKEAIYANKNNGTSYATYFVSDTGIASTSKLASRINLKGGDDYIEVNGDIANIVGTAGKKTYYLNSKETYIYDVEQTGTITLDGILLTGGKGAGVGQRIQQTTVNGQVHTFTYNLDYNKKELTITHENSGHKVVIGSVSDYGNGNRFGFEASTTNAANATPLITYNAENTQQITGYTINLKSTYYSYAEFQNDLTFVTNLASNSLNYRSGNDLYLYDKENANKIIKLNNYYKDNGQALNTFSSTLITYDQDGNAHSSALTGNINVAGLTWTDTNSNQYNLDDYFNNITASNQNIEIYYRASDSYIIKQNNFNTYSIYRNGEDLYFSDTTNGSNPLLKIKNYFTFQHDNGLTNIIVQGGSQDSPTYKQLTKEQINNYFNINLSNDNEYFKVNEQDPRTRYNGGLGDDIIVGSAKNEVFQSSGTKSTNSSISQDGNDIFTGGGGQDLFIFSNNYGSDIITDFGNNDKIYIRQSLGSNDMTYKRENQDLVIQTRTKTDPNATFFAPLYAEIRVKNYFTNVNYKTDSRIVLFDSSSIYSGDYGVTNPASHQFTAQELLGFVQTAITGQNYTQVLNEAANINTANRNETLEYNSFDSMILSNTYSNNIIINNINTHVKFSTLDSSYLDDGNDIYTINTSNDIYNSPLPEDRNQFRTEIEMDLKGGHDSVLGGTFKGQNEFGDIVTLNDTLSNIYFNVENGATSAKSVTAVLSDNSTIKVELNNNNANDLIFKVGDTLLSLNDIQNLPNVKAIYGTNESDTINIENEFRNYYIKFLGGDDTIITGHGNDTVIAGTGNDKITLSEGNDKYMFNKGDGIDTFTFNDDRASLNSTFIIDSAFNINDVKYFYDPEAGNIYLTFGQNDGVIFKEASWQDFAFIKEGLKIQFNNGQIITVPDEIKVIDYIPFGAAAETPTEQIINNVRIAKGTSLVDEMTVDQNYSNIIIAKDGNDSINGGEYSPKRSLIFGGKGDDIIHTGYQDILTVKEGDGHDTIDSPFPYYTINVLHNDTYKLANDEKLFDITSANHRDLTLTYDTAGDSVTIENFFDPLGNKRGNVAVSIYNKDNDQMKLYYLNDLLANIGINASMLNTTPLTVLAKDTPSYWTSPQGSGYIIGGEIAYQYLNSGTYQATANTEALMNQITNNYIIQPKS